ncbi:hypothetical protein HDV00_000476 [Rhizophlyctis rosea]|nr:hypothetical protein HDV00_000476 [Rhizophlyctis rosea]
MRCIASKHQRGVKSIAIPRGVTVIAGAASGIIVIALHPITQLANICTTFVRTRIATSSSPLSDKPARTTIPIGKTIPESSGRPGSFNTNCLA